MTRWILLCTLAVGLCSCGGGGGGTGTAMLKSQSIAFAAAGPTYAILDEGTYANAASGGFGSGAITYQSDAPGVATVDAQSGAVTFVSAGVATISASKAADSTYASAQASYVLRIAPRTVAITAWTGASGSDVTFPALPLAVNFIRSTDPNCDPTNVGACANGKSVATSASTITDTTATMTQQAAYWLQHGSHLTDGVLAPEVNGTGMEAQQVVSFNGRLWTVERPSMSVRSSADGVNWRVETANSGIPARTGWVLLAANNALWLLGGLSSQYGIAMTDVWKSVDGKTWTFVSDVTWPARLRFAAAAFNGKLWIYGGGYGPDLDDVWSSTDGVTWTETTAAATGMAREQHTLTAFNGRLWIIGGWQGGTLQDIWSSADGVAWVQESSQAPFGHRFAHSVATDGTRLWLVAGQNEYQQAQCDVWSSTDGRSWTQLTAQSEMGCRYTSNTLYWNGAVWMVGERGADIWTSVDGSHWNKRSLAARIPGATSMAFGTYRSRLWYLSNAGWIWSSADGLTWSGESRAPPSDGGNLQFVELPDRLLLFGLYQVPPPSTPPTTPQLWQSTDGKSWSLSSTQPPYSPTGMHAAVPFKGKIVVFAASASDSTIAEIWSTTDGSSWTSIATQAGFGPREVYRVFAYNNRLWVVGGVLAGSGLGDVWSSPDGVTWTQNATPGLPPGQFQQSLTFPDHLCVYGASLAHSVYSHDAWCSADGLSWQKVADDVADGALVFLSGEAWALGGNDERPWESDLVWKSTDGVSWRMGYQNVLTFR